jgi:drug/metabolite transporter (DMT)-like permease
MMSSSPSTVRLGPLRLPPAAAGTLCCLVAVLGYSAANACMRKLSMLACDSAWAICNKELITVVAVGPWLLRQAWRRKSGFPRGRPLAILVAAGLATELIGNIGLQWGYAIVGLAVMLPANTSFVLIATTVLGGILLGERVSARNVAAVGLLIFAVAVLGLGVARSAPAATAIPPASPLAVAAAIAVAAVAGVVFSLLGIAIRHCVTGTTSYSAVVVIITGTGVLSLGPLSFVSAGAAKLMATPWQQYELMFTAGICNLVAFLAVVRGLHLTTVLHVNTINAGQVAVAAVAGVLFFGEPCNRWLLLGVGLMIVGILAFGSPIDQEAVDAHV